MSDDRKVELKINKGDLQTILVLNRGVLTSTYSRWVEYVLPNFNISLGEWNVFAESQGSACRELEKVTRNAFFKTNPPNKPSDWENFNDTETKIKISFKAARAIVQVLVGAMDLEDSEASNLRVDSNWKEYYDHAIIKNKKLSCIKGLLSQMVEQGCPVKKNKIPDLELRLRINEPDVEMAKFFAGLK
jgi:hypothetical protein